jgi:hypothetical protein
VALVVLVACAWLVVVLGARMYERSLLKTGGRVKWREALRAA